MVQGLDLQSWGKLTIGSILDETLKGDQFMLIDGYIQVDINLVYDILIYRAEVYARTESN